MSQTFKPIAVMALPLVVAGTTLLLLNGMDGFPPRPTPGLPDPGAVTHWGLPVVRGLRDLAAAVTLGGLILAATTVPASANDPGALSAAQLKALRLVALSAALWVWAAVADMVLTYADLAGTPPLATQTLWELRYFVTDLDQGRSLAMSGLLASLVVLGALTAQRVTTLGVLAVVGVLALWPLALTGHAASEEAHDAAVNAQFVHLVAASAWMGGLVTLGAIRGALGSASTDVLGRYSRLAGWCFLGMAVSGAQAAVLRVPSWSALDSSYGGLVLVKIAGFGVLGAAGWYHRRCLLAKGDLLVGGGARFWRLVIGELVIMSVAIGAGVAMSRTPPPVEEVSRLDTATALLGYPLPNPLGWSQWLTAWRIDTVWAPVAIGGLLLYAGGVARLRRRGDVWPVGRLFAWTLGCLGLLWATSGAPGVYGDTLFSMHMVQHMTVATAVPALLVMGAPITLSLRTLTPRTDGSRGAREWVLIAVHAWPMRILSNPLVAGVMFIVGLVAFYYSSLFELSLRTHTGHVLMTAHFLFSGYLFANVICGVDPGLRRPPYPLRMLLLMVAFAFHAFFSISLMSSSTVLARDWFEALGRDWGNSLERDQYIGASLGWALGDYPLLILAIGLINAWVSADHREGRRLDRQADRDDDRELRDYNAYLATLHTGHVAAGFGRTAGVRDDAAGRDTPEGRR